MYPSTPDGYMMLSRVPCTMQYILAGYPFQIQVYTQAIISSFSKSVNLFIFLKFIWYIYIIEYYSATKKSKIMLLAATWMDPEAVTLS